MGKIIIVTFAFMGFAFYEMSGGADFVPVAEEKRAALELERIEQDRMLAETRAKQPQIAKVIEPVLPVVLASAVVTQPDVSVDVSKADEVVTAVAAALEADKAEELVAQAVDAVPAEAELLPDNDLREVTAARVNMRNGPGQSFNVMAKLTAGEQVEILQDPGDGWVKLRVVESGRVGWMADFLLTAANN